MTHGLNSPELGELLKELADREISLWRKKGGGLSVSPKSRLNADLLARIKKHKQGIIAMLLMVSEEHHGVLICRACLYPIRDSEPHVAIENLETGEVASFHRDPECTWHAHTRLSEKVHKGESHAVHLLHVCDDAAAGYECEAGCFA